MPGECIMQQVGTPVSWLQGWSELSHSRTSGCTMASLYSYNSKCIGLKWFAIPLRYASNSFSSVSPISIVLSHSSTPAMVFIRDRILSSRLQKLASAGSSLSKESRNSPWFGKFRYFCYVGY